MGIFSGIQEAKSTKGGNYLKPGNYLLQVSAVKMQKSQVGSKKFFIVETRVVEATQTDEEIKPNGVDTEPAWLVELPGKFPELALGNVKAFLMAAYGYLAEVNDMDHPGEEDITEEMADDAVDEESPLPGIFLTAKAFQKSTAGGGQFTRVNWGVPVNAAELAREA